MDLIGSVNGKDCIIIDDMLDTGLTLAWASETLKWAGAKKIYAYVTHGIFGENSIDNIKRSSVSKLIISNTLDIPEEVQLQLPDDWLA